MLAEGDALAVQLLLHEAVTVQVVGGLEGEKGGDAHHPRPQDFVVEMR